MTAIAPRKRIYAGDDLLFVMEWRVGTPKAIGDPVDVSGFVIESDLFQAGKLVAGASVAVEPTTGRLTIHIDELATANLEGEHELRVRYTDADEITTTFVVVPVEIIP